MNVKIYDREIYNTIDRHCIRMRLNIINHDYNNQELLTMFKQHTEDTILNIEDVLKYLGYVRAVCPVFYSSTLVDTGILNKILDLVNLVSFSHENGIQREIEMLSDYFSNIVINKRRVKLLHSLNSGVDLLNYLSKLTNMHILTGCFAIATKSCDSANLKICTHYH